MKRELSILIPVYNGKCVPLVDALVRQVAQMEGLCYEVIVADDGSTDEAALAANRAINAYLHCRYVERGFNAGRSAIRNFLAQEARYAWLLFIDCDMTIVRSDFLSAYLHSPAAEVAYGGYEVGPAPDGDRNLRYLYEKAAEAAHTPEQRRQRPYRDFHTSNFMIRRDVMLQHPFDERFRRYGYEDVLLGKQLHRAGVTIDHVDNPVGFCVFEDNAAFMRKTEEGLHTLHEFSDDLRGYNSLLTLANGIHIGLVRALIRLFHRLFGPLERRCLCGRHPRLAVFRLYKLGYYLSLT